MVTLPKSIKEASVVATPRSTWSRSIENQINFPLQVKVFSLEVHEKKKWNKLVYCFRCLTYLSMSDSPHAVAHQRTFLRSQSRVE